VDATAALTVAILFGATLVRSAFGFGEALVAVPLLALFMPVDVAAPLAVLVSITVAAFVMLQDWRLVHYRSAARLIVATLAGTPLGLLLLTTASEQTVKALLGVVIIAFSSWTLLVRSPPPLDNDRLSPIFGVAAGVLGGAYGMNGPPVVMFGTLRRWQPQHFRATLQGYFLPASAAVMIGYWSAGLWTGTVTGYYVRALPGVIVAIGVGRLLNRRMRPGRFFTYVHVGLIGIGALLLLQAF
jgi:uncharacterized membrane protein YfcA